jgi:hypothetical protein
MKKSLGTTTKSKAMGNDELSTPENILSLKKELALYYKEEQFLKCKNMGQILRTSLELIWHKENSQSEFNLSDLPSFP